MKLITLEKIETPTPWGLEISMVVTVQLPSGEQSVANMPPKVLLHQADFWTFWEKRLSYQADMGRCEPYTRSEEEWKSFLLTLCPALDAAKVDEPNTSTNQGAQSDEAD